MNQNEAADAIMGAASDAYDAVRRVRWAQVVAIAEARAQRDDERDVVAMFRAVRDFEQAFLATRKGRDLERIMAKRDAEGIPPMTSAVVNALSDLLTPKVCPCAQCTAQREAQH